MTHMNKMTFENFMCDIPENRSIISALASLEQKPFKEKVLCLWGGNSSGKTHLLQAVLKASNRLRTTYITSDQLCLKLAFAIRCNKSQDFEDYFENVDILLIDDSQFLVGKYALDFLYERIVPKVHQYVILASDCDPQNIGLLRSDGVVLKIEQPSVAVRRKLVSQMAESFQLQLDEPVQLLIATELTDVRRIRGFLIFLKAVKKKYP